MMSAIEFANHIAARRASHWSVSGNVIEVRFAPSDRRQLVKIQEDDDYYIFRSTVLGTGRVTQSVRRWRHWALLAWERNSEHDLVTFAFDDADRLIGLIRQPKATLDESELELYVDVLAYECDRFEYVLTGGDSY